MTGRVTDGDWAGEEYRRDRRGWCSLQLAGIVTGVVLVARVTVRLVRR